MASRSRRHGDLNADETFGSLILKGWMCDLEMTSADVYQTKREAQAWQKNERTLYVNRVRAGIMRRLCDTNGPGTFLGIDPYWLSSHGPVRGDVCGVHTAHGGAGIGDVLGSVFTVMV